MRCSTPRSFCIYADHGAGWRQSEIRLHWAVPCRGTFSILQVDGRQEQDGLPRIASDMPGVAVSVACRDQNNRLVQNRVSSE